MVSIEMIGEKGSNDPMQLIKRITKKVFNSLGYKITKLDNQTFDCKSLPAPKQEIIAKTATYFSDSFQISPNSGMSRDEIKTKIKGFFWHYPFEFGDLSVEASQEESKRVRTIHRQRYLHLFPAILSMTGGSLSGNTVLDIGCNAGFWSIQARQAGAESVLGVEASAKNIDQANFILEVTGLDGIEYKVKNVFELTKEELGQFDITFFLGLLYHLDKPIFALERLYEVTKWFTVIDTSLLISRVPLIEIKEDRVHDQNYSNNLRLVPSESAVLIMLRYVGFREIFCVQNYNSNLPKEYRGKGVRGAFIAVK